MKKILILTGVISLLNTSGCIVAEGGHHGHSRRHGHFESRPAVIVEPPVIVVRPPEIIVR